MTPSRWLRDYLYIPSGEPARETRTAINTAGSRCCSAACGTAPPGRSSPGAFHGIGQLIGRWRVRRTGCWPLRRPAGSRAAALRHVQPGVRREWVLFRADSIGSAFELLASVFTPGTPSTLVTPLVLLAIAASIGAQYLPRDPAIRLREGFSRLGPVVQGRRSRWCCS